MKRQVRVLIADDQGPTRQGLRALLSLCPQVEIVAEAIDGRAAVDLVATRQPDVVLMDMQMPVMDGLEATRQIKEQWPEVKVIALTMHPKYRVEAVAAGIDAFLLKGTSTGALLDIILAQRPDLSGQPSKTQGAK
jgi:DNA-binding NarL/FixJ family response regulator